MTNKLQRLELTWPGKDERINPEPRILLEDKEKSYSKPAVKTDLLENSPQPMFDNMLIHGDNLLALKALEQDFAGKVKCIYIDPPYNTGKAFEHYDDGLEHSIWLSLMRDRLEILRRLLAEDGFFCCQVDDSEGQYLKILCDEIFGRNNYLTTFYIQVRYPNKTLAEDSDYQKVIEQCHIYARQKYLAKVNRPIAEYDIEKFKWKVIEKAAGHKIHLGNKKVVIFKPDEYEIVEIQPSLEGLKETWATGSLARVRASAGEFFELYLSNRKSLDGLGCLYKVYGIGEDGLGYRYVSGPKKESATKGKFYSGIPLNRLHELKEGKSYKYLPVSNFYDMAGNFGNCRLEGGVDFKGGKKPEILLETLIRYFSNPGDLVLDSFLGSGTTAAVAQKMGRRWIGVEMGDHVYTHCLPRLQKVINGDDQSGITKAVNWQGGGGFKFYELASSLIVKDKYGQQIISDKYNAEMLAEAMCKILDYHYQPDPSVYWKQGYSSEKSFIFTTTACLQETSLDKMAEEIGDNNLLICCSAFSGNPKAHSNISVKKIPAAILKKCEWGMEGYPLNISAYHPTDEDFEFDEEE